MERGSLQTRRERLTELVPQIGPIALACDRVLPVSAALEALFPEGGLGRGSIIGCQGATAMSVALATVSQASAAGSWLACVGVPTLGLRAASEVGIALERLVMVASPAEKSPAEKSPQEAGATANVMSALIDGFDLIVLRDAAAIPMALGRRLQSRLQARGAVLVIVGNSGPFICDLIISGVSAQWEGLGDGSGRLARRRLALSATGRRSPRAKHVEVWLPGATGGIESITPLPHHNQQLQPTVLIDPVSPDLLQAG